LDFSSTTFDIFCVTLFKKALEKDIKAIGITDYFSIDNYKKVKKFVNNIEGIELTRMVDLWRI
jgi:predicted metal-dependent phosphoesterase TrpH